MGPSQRVNPPKEDDGPEIFVTFGCILGFRGLNCSNAVSILDLKIEVRKSG
jgi:hypothetical protein